MYPVSVTSAAASGDVTEIEDSGGSNEGNGREGAVQVLVFLL
ncbi:hypothetical protein [Candidatus Ichthyocystis sparus]|nr:hypothetical protein [Candidatus Ichthyocystis sparus]